jgi:hypothetical protein
LQEGYDQVLRKIREVASIHYADVAATPARVSGGSGSSAFFRRSPSPSPERPWTAETSDSYAAARTPPQQQQLRSQRVPAAAAAPAGGSGRGPASHDVREVEELLQKMKKLSSSPAASDLLPGSVAAASPRGLRSPLTPPQSAGAQQQRMGSVELRSNPMLTAQKLKLHEAVSR